ncbi:MAG: T9SS type A sorting domain-containing protein [Salinivirgaceae bacterium]|nr:T9SS type A sorting domain-containing protein [Salinivirgaceae bacterium]
MRKLTFLVACLFVVFTLSAQKQATRSLLQKGPKIKNIATGEAATPSKAVTKIFNYDNNEIAGGIGSSSGAHSIGMVIQIPASALVNYVEQTIDAFRYGIDNNSIITDAKAVIFEGNLDGSPVVEQNITIGNIISGWNLVTLSEGYKIPSATDIFVGIMVTTDAGGYTISFDTDAASAPEYSGHLFFNGAYYGTLTGDVGIDADWNLQAILTDGNGIGEMSDLTITAIDKTTQACGLSATEILKVTLYNAGQSKINEKFDLTVEVNNTPVVQQVSPTGFVTGTEMVVEVSSFDMSAYGTYDVVATFDYDDAFTNNNTFETLISTGDSKVTIDLTTDAYPGETQWYLVDINGDVVAANGTLEAETQTVTEVCVDAAGCYTWVIYDAYGDGIMGYNSPAGTFTISYNGEVIATCPAGGDFGFEYYVFGIGSGCPENDIVLNSLNIPNQAAPGELEIKGKIFNNGSANLTSFDVTYTVGDYTSPVYSVSGIDLAIGETYDFVHDTKYNFTTDGNYTIVVTVSNPNGVADENPDNNTLEDEITIVTGIMFKKQLFEHFTSSTCGPCASYTPTADALLAGNQGNYSLIRYQVNWPGEGDPYYIQQAGDRVGYYGVSGVPSVYRNGTYDMDVTQEGFNAYAEQTTVINLDVEGTFEGTNVTINATINPIAELAAGLTAHIVIVENVTYDNASTNGEDEFHHVMMQMLPTSAGTELGAIAANGSFTITESFDMSTTFVEEMDDLSAVVFIQDDATQEVLQSEIVAITAPVAETVTVTFNVDMTAPIESGLFAVGTDVLYVTGNFNGWDEPGTGESLILTDTDGDKTYTVSVEITTNFGELQYKYFRNTTWAGGEWEGEPNRIITVGTGDITTNDTWVVGIGEDLLNAITISPNPFKDELVINNAGNANEIVISNVLGQAVVKVSEISNRIELSTSELQNGVYFITITDANNNSRIERIVKQ